MANIKFTNFAHSLLAVGIGPGDTSISVTGGHGARFPTLGAGEYFYATLEDASNNREIVKVTARATDVLTVVRAQDNTSALSWNAGDTIALRLNAAALEVIRDSSAIDFVPAGTGAVATNVQSKLREFVSVEDFGAVGDGVTNDTAAVQAAVTHCFTTGDQLYWPDGTYLTTASISNFHDVQHRGPGAVQRGSDVFYVDPKEGQTNTLYVAASGGSVVNDALSSSQAVPSLQAAFDILSNYWPLDGKFVIKLAAGTYTGSASVARLGPSNADSAASGMAMRNALTIMGPDVGYDATSNPTPTPTAILNAAGAAAVGIALEREIKAVVRDVKFTNYNGSASSVGVFADNNSWLQCINVHADTCTYGIAGYNHSLVDAKGGTINACTVGIQTLFNCKHEIGNQGAGAAGQGPFITNCTTAGFRAQEGSTGHSDYVSYQGNALAVDVQVNSRVNLNGSDFKLNTVAVRVASGSNVFLAGVSWNTGTANANTENLRIVDASSIAGQNSNSWRALARQTTTQTVNGIASASVVWTGTLGANLYTSVPGSVYLGKALKVVAAGTITGVAGTKTIHLRLGGSILGGITFDAANNGSFVFEGVVYLTGSANQKTICRGQTSIGSGTEAGYAATTFNTASAADLTLTLTASLSAADTIAFEIVDFEAQG